MELEVFLSPWWIQVQVSISSQLYKRSDQPHAILSYASTCNDFFKCLFINKKL